MDGESIQHAGWQMPIVNFYGKILALYSSWCSLTGRGKQSRLFERVWRMYWKTQTDLKRHSGHFLSFMFSFKKGTFGDLIKLKLKVCLSWLKHCLHKFLIWVCAETLNSSPRFILQLFILLRLAGLNFVTTTFSLKKFCDLFVRLVSRFRNADGDEDGADGAEAGVQPEGSVEAHLVNHRGVRWRQHEVDLKKTTAMNLVNEWSSQEKETEPDFQSNIWWMAMMNNFIIASARENLS